MTPLGSLVQRLFSNILLLLLIKKNNKGSSTVSINRAVEGNFLIGCKIGGRGAGSITSLLC